MEVSGEPHTTPALSLAKELCFAHGAQLWSGHFGDEKNLSPLLGFEPQIVQPIA